MANGNNSEINLDALLDGTLDDLADLPEFAPYPAGAHRVVIDWRVLQGKEAINGRPVVMLDMKGIETVELVDKENDKPISKDQETSVMHTMDNEFGQGAFKKLMGILAEHYGAGSNRELMEKSKKAEVLVVTSTRQNKEKTKKFTAIENMQVL